MSGKPGLQVGIDPVGQPEPGATMHLAAFLGGHHVARHLGFDLTAAKQQVVRGTVLQPGKRDGEAARPLQHRGAYEMEDGDQRVLPAKGKPQPLDQPVAATLRQRGGDAGDLLGDPAQQQFGRGGFGARLAAELLQAQFHAVTLQDRLAGARTRSRLIADFL
jgi:hypothetical protein